MVGIAQMFAEYSGEDVDWFQMVFAFERMADRRTEYQRRHMQTKKWLETKRRWRSRQPKRARKVNTPEQRKELAKQRKLRWLAKNGERALEMRREAVRRWRAKQKGLTA